MEWSVVKIGIPMFDVLHAYGVALLLALISGQEVTLKDEGLLYGVSLPLQTLSTPSVDILEKLFHLPNEGTILADHCHQSQGALEQAILDGLLAALFTMPGIRVASVDFLRKKQSFTPTAIEQALLKITQQVHKWKAFLQRGDARDAWIANFLQDYQRECPALPTLTIGKAQGEVNVPMTLDPAFGYAFRAALNTGRMTSKTQVTVRGTHYAPALALFGASRFLRAQYIAGDLVLFVVPFSRQMTLTWESKRPTLPCCSDHLDHALMRYWVNLHVENRAPEYKWSGLAYSVFQLQGAQQSIVCESGLLSLEWLATLERRGGKRTISTWRQWLNQRNINWPSPDLRGSLIECLKHQQIHCWLLHLHELTSSLRADAWRSFDEERTISSLRAYTFEEVRRITSMMDHPSLSHPLRSVLEREGGTLYFGRALRLLGRTNHGLFCDLIDQLEPIRSLEDLLLLLYQLVHECELASAHERFILVPTEDDFGYLLDDVHQFGVRPIIGILIVLSALRYPRTAEGDKYALHTLIGVLLQLVRHIESLTKEEEETDKPLAVEHFVADPDLFFTHRKERTTSDD